MLRVLMPDATTARDALWEATTEVCVVVKKALKEESHGQDADIRRGVVRASALVEALLTDDAKRFKSSTCFASMPTVAEMVSLMEEKLSHECLRRQYLHRRCTERTNP